MVSIIVMVFLIVYGAITEQAVYACSSDRDNLPIDVKIQCERLTKGQWWHK